MIDFIVPSEESEIISDFLWGLGVVAIEERDATDRNRTLRTSMGEDSADAIKEVLERFPQVFTARVEIPRSIADTWREHVAPTWVNDLVALVPAWMAAPENCVPIFIEPLDTFGLGNHPTTVLALRLALKHVSAESSVFDMGCGSGVLAVALAKLSTCSAQVYDIAHSAQQAVAENCRLNSVKSVTWRDGIEGASVDAVLANILAPVLIELSSQIQNALRSGGVVILSGMRTEQSENVTRQYTQCSIVDSVSLDGWTAVVLQKN